MNLSKDNRMMLLLALVSGICFFIGSYAGNFWADLQKEYYTVTNVQELKEAPSQVAGGINFTVKPGDKALVIEKVDYSKIDKKSPTVVRLQKDVNATDETTKKPYQLTALEYYKVQSSQNDTYVLEVTSNTGELVHLKVEKSKTVPVDAGLWKKLRFADRNICWVKQ